MSNAAGDGGAVLERVIQLLGKQTKSDSTDWSAATSLDEAGIDSFDFIEYIFLLEDEFGIEIKYNQNDVENRFLTIGDVASAIARLVDGKQPTNAPAGTAGSFA